MLCLADQKRIAHYSCHGNRAQTYRKNIGYLSTHEKKEVITHCSSAGGCIKDSQRDSGWGSAYGDDESVGRDRGGEVRDRKMGQVNVLKHAEKGEGRIYLLASQQIWHNSIRFQEPTVNNYEFLKLVSLPLCYGDACCLKSERGDSQTLKDIENIPSNKEGGEKE